MNIKRYNQLSDYWRKLYWNRYSKFHSYENQPDRFLFKKKVKLLEKWIGKQPTGNIRGHFLYQTFINLTNWSSNWFICFIEALEEIEIKNNKLFKELIVKLVNNKFSWEVSELISEISFLKKFVDLSEIEVDSIVSNKLKPDIVINSKKFGKTIIEVTRLSDSEEESFCKKCIYQLEQLDEIVNFVTYAYKFHRRPSELEWNDLIKRINQKLIDSSKYIVEKNEFVTIIIIKAKVPEPDFETFKQLCRSENLSYGERAGWFITNKTHERIQKKAKKKEKYAKIGINYILSIYGIEDLFFLYGKEAANDILSQIVDYYDYPIKFNYWYMFENENYAKDMKSFVQVKFNLPNSITISSFFKDYENIERFPVLNLLKQNYV